MFGIVDRSQKLPYHHHFHNNYKATIALGLSFGVFKIFYPQPAGSQKQLYEPSNVLKRILCVAAAMMS